MRARMVAAVGLVAALALAGCSGSTSTSTSPAAPTPTPSVTSASTSPTPVSTPPTTPTSASPTVPSSPYEADPAVRALRLWGIQVAMANNAGTFSNPTLNSLETAAFQARVAQYFKDDAGLYYPGPFPFTVLSVATPSATAKNVSFCFVGTGFAQSRTTKKPVKALTLVSALGTMVSVNGAWVVQDIENGTQSCTGVKVVTPTWS